MNIKEQVLYISLIFQFQIVLFILVTVCRGNSILYKGQLCQNKKWITTRKKAILFFFFVSTLNCLAADALLSFSMTSTALNRHRTCELQ